MLFDYRTMERSFAIKVSDYIRLDVLKSSIEGIMIRIALLDNFSGTIFIYYVLFYHSLPNPGIKSQLKELVLNSPNVIYYIKKRNDVKTFVLFFSNVEVHSG